MSRPLPNPEQIAPAVILRGITIGNNTFVQRLQGFTAINRHFTQAKVGHTKIVAADQKDTVKVVGRREIFAPVAQEPGQRLQRPAPGGIERAAVGVGE